MDRDDTTTLSVSYPAIEVHVGCILSIIHPTTWLPNGKPILACSDATLDRVTIMANMIKPICTPSRVAERPSSEVCLEPAVEERMLFSKRIYSTPTRTINNPPASLRDVRSVHDHGIEANEESFEWRAKHIYESHRRGRTYIILIFSVLIAGKRVNMLIDEQATAQVPASILLWMIKSRP